MATYTSQQQRFVKDILYAFYRRDMLGSIPLNDSIAEVTGQMLWAQARDRWFSAWPMPSSTSGSSWGRVYVTRDDVRRHYESGGGRDHFSGPVDRAMAISVSWKWRGALEEAKMSARDSEYHSVY